MGMGGKYCLRLLQFCTRINIMVPFAQSACGIGGGMGGRGMGGNGLLQGGVYKPMAQVTPTLTTRT
jgi:hypothetical protein